MRAAQQHARVAHQVWELPLLRIAKLYCLESDAAACHVPHAWVRKEAKHMPPGYHGLYAVLIDAIERKTSDARQNYGCRLTNELSQP